MTYDENSLLNLVSHIHSQSQELIRRRLCSLGLDDLASSHGNILFCLSQTESLTLGELSKKINRGKSTTTALVHKLERAGFVEIEKSKGDSRRKIIRLTDMGMQYNKKTSAISRELIEQSYRNFTEDEKKQLVALLNKLSENLE